MKRLNKLDAIDYKKLNIYIILRILEYISIHFKFFGSRKELELITGYHRDYLEGDEWSEKQKKGFALIPFSMIIKINDLYGKWGKMYKKLFFLWKTVRLDIFRNIDNLEEFNNKLLNDSELIMRLTEKTSNLYYRVVYTTCKKYKAKNNFVNKLTLFWRDEKTLVICNWDLEKLKNGSLFW